MLHWFKFVLIFLNAFGRFLFSWSQLWRFVPLVSCNIWLGHRRSTNPLAKRYLQTSKAQENLSWRQNSFSPSSTSHCVAPAIKGQFKSVHIFEPTVGSYFSFSQIFWLSDGIALCQMEASAVSWKVRPFEMAFEKCPLVWHQRKLYTLLLQKKTVQHTFASVFAWQYS